MIRFQLLQAGDLMPGIWNGGSAGTAYFPGSEKNTFTSEWCPIKDSPSAISWDLTCGFHIKVSFQMRLD